MPSHFRLLVLVATATMLSAGSLAPAFADECGSSTLATVAAKMQGGQGSMESYSANARIHAKMHGFPFFGLTLSGVSTYEKPGNYTLLLNKPPRAADKVEAIVHDLSADVMSSNHWSSYDASATCAPVGKLLVHLAPKTAGETKAVDLTVDAAAARVDKATFVRDDGTITLDQRFENVQGHDVIVHQDLGLMLTQIRADVTVDYNDIDVIQAVAGS